MNCTIPTCSDFLDTAITPPDTGLRDWLTSQAPTHGLARATLLAFAYDGVIWGALSDSVLQTAHDIVPGGVSPPFRDETLLEARLFNESAELHIWRDGDGFWHGRLLRPAAESEQPTFTEYLDEATILWGTRAQIIEDAAGQPTRFTLFSDGIQGLQHIPPLTLSGHHPQRPLRLTVHHYLDPDQDFARIALSRLVTLTHLPVEEQS